MIDAIREPLAQLCGRLDGALGATVMGFDGIEVDTYLAQAQADDEPDFSALLVEYSALLAQVQRSAQMFAAGALEEVSISSEHLTTIIRPLSDGYFVALALRSTASLGKGRYLLRMAAVGLTDALV